MGVGDKPWKADQFYNWNLTWESELGLIRIKHSISNYGYKPKSGWKYQDIYLNDLEYCHQKEYWEPERLRLNNK